MAVELSRGTSGSGATWVLTYRRTIGGDDCLELSIDGNEPNSACGFDIPATTEIGFGGGLKPGRGDFFLYGLTSDRILTVAAESSAGDTRVGTVRMPFSAGRPHLRFFVLDRKPVENVSGIAGLGEDSDLIQRISFPSR